MTYLIFTYENYYPKGGLSDLWHKCNKVEDLINHLKKVIRTVYLPENLEIYDVMKDILYRMQIDDDEITITYVGRPILDEDNPDKTSEDSDFDANSLDLSRSLDQNLSLLLVELNLTRVKDVDEMKRKSLVRLREREESNK